MSDHARDHGDRHAAGGPDPIPGLGGDSLWEETAGDLHPTTDPDSFTVTATSGNALVIANVGDAQLHGGNDSHVTADGSVFVNATTGDITLDANGNVILTGLPTSSVGLPAGALWSDGGTLKIA